MPIAIENNEIHIWSTELTLAPGQEEQRYILLSPDEQKRAYRFHFPIHQQRFIAARSTLRTILSFYLPIAAKDILFSYDEHKKPSLSKPKDTGLQFNLSHSHDLWVCAFTRNHAIGIDVEKAKDDYSLALAKRFFHPKEVDALLSLPPKEQSLGFYRLWARKEAIIKATGKGLSLPLSSFSVSVNDINEIVTLTPGEKWALFSLSIHPAFQSAVATNQPVKKLSFWKIFDQLPQLDGVFYF